MKVTHFAIEVAHHEKKKKQVDIAQIKEVLKVVNMLTNGRFYAMIWRLKDGE